MPLNVEIKARVSNFPSFLSLARKVVGEERMTMHQVDTFFNCPNGRLKLRVIEGDRAQLIFYRRPDTSGPKVSEFTFLEVDRPDDLKNTLSLAYGIQGEVRKTRKLFLVGQTRIHADDVQGLGTFMELEVRLQEGQSVHEGNEIAKDLMKKLGVVEADLVIGAYMDHLLNNLNKCNVSL